MRELILGPAPWQLLLAGPCFFPCEELLQRWLRAL